MLVGTFTSKRAGWECCKGLQNCCFSTPWHGSVSFSNKLLRPAPTHPAGFHNASLYPALRPAVPPLVALLRDEEDRTRANAAGALGNLVRNSGMLCHDIMAAGALQVCFNSYWYLSVWWGGEVLD